VKPTPTETTRDEAKLLSDLRAALPEGWTVERSARDVAPDDWYTNDGPGLFVEGRGPGGTFRIWFVPEDWVGIRKVDARSARSTYWEGVLLGRGYKSLTMGPVAIQEAVRKLGMQTPSLVNSGWGEAERIWGTRWSLADDKARALIAAHAPDEGSFSEAAHSLVVLGVPARAVLLRAAAEARGEEREFAVSALGHFSGAEVTSALGKAVNDPTCSRPRHSRDHGCRAEAPPRGPASRIRPARTRGRPPARALAPADGSSVCSRTARDHPAPPSRPR
jgi:hypothetical protein